MMIRQTNSLSKPELIEEKFNDMSSELCKTDDLKTHINYLMRSTPTLEQYGLFDSAARGHARLIIMYSWLGEYADAEEWVLRAYRHATTHRSGIVHGSYQVGRAVAFAMQGNHAAALRVAQRGLSVPALPPVLWGQLQALIAVATWRMGDAAGALEVLDRVEAGGQDAESKAYGMLARAEILSWTLLCRSSVLADCDGLATNLRLESNEKVCDRILHCYIGARRALRTVMPGVTTLVSFGLGRLRSLRTGSMNAQGFIERGIAYAHRAHLTGLEQMARLSLISLLIARGEHRAAFHWAIPVANAAKRGEAGPMNDVALALGAKVCRLVGQPAMAQQFECVLINGVTEVGPLDPPSLDAAGLTEIKAPLRQRAEQVVEHLGRLVLENRESTVGIDVLARRLGISRRSLETHVKLATGRSPRVLIDLMRMSADRPDGEDDESVSSLLLSRADRTLQQSSIGS